MTGDPYRTPPVPPRTVFVNPVVFFRIVQRHVSPPEALLRILRQPSPHVRIPTAAETWTLVADPDCPSDYAWPETLPPEVAEVVRAGINDARKVRA